MGKNSERTFIRIKVKLGKYKSIAYPIARGVAELAAESIRAEISIDDHTLEDLRQLGHPYRIEVHGTPKRQRLAGYSIRKMLGMKTTKPGEGSWARVAKTGRFQTGITKGRREEREGDLGHSIKKIHKQSGSLLDSITTSTRTVGNAVRASAKVDRAKVKDYDPIWLITGTRKMIGRDFIAAAKIGFRPRVALYIKTEVNRLIQQIAAGGGGGSGGPFSFGN